MNNKPGRSPKPASGKPVASKSGGAAAAARTAPAQDVEFAFLDLLPSAAVALELPDFKILAANAAAARLCGAPLETNWLPLLAEDDRPPFQRWSATPELLRRSFDLAAGNAVDVMAARVQRPGGAALLLLLSDSSAERASEQALRFSEERFRRAYERNLAGIYRTTLDGKFLDCNTALARMFGFESAAEMMKANAISLYFKEEDRRRVIEQAADQRPRSFEMLMRRIDGSPIWVLENVVAVEERPGTRPVLYGTVIEITERKLAEEMLRASEAYNRELVEGASDIIYTQDLNGNFTWANEAALRLTGYSLEEVRQKNMKDVVAPEYWDVAVRHRREKLEEHVTSTPYEVELVTKGGERLLLEVNTRLILRDGTPLGVQGIARDVTARRRAEVALRESENKFRAVADTAPCAILIYNEKRFLYVNAASENVTGYPREELLGMGVWDVVHPDHRQNVQERGLARLRGELVPQRYEFKLRHKSGETRWVDFAAGSIQYDGGTAAVGTAVDITERKRAERLQAALYLIAEKATSAEDLEKFYVAIHGIVGELLYARNFYIALLTPEGDALRFVYAVDEADDTYPSDAVPLGKGLTEYVLRTGRPQLVKEERFAELCAAGEIEQVGAPSVDWLGVPLKSGNRVFGVLAVQSYDSRVRFEARDQEILTFVSQHVAAAIERKRNLDALRESEARYRSLVDSAVYGIFRSTRAGKFVSVNPALVKILGYDSPEEVMALDLLEDVYVDTADRERVVNGLSQGENGAVEVRWKRKDRSIITVRLSGRRTETQRGETFEMIAEDVTERRGLEDQLRQSQKMEAVGRLAGGLAHDFNNLLTVIKGYSELMGNELDPKDPMRAEVTEIHRAAERAAGLTRQLLAFSRQQVLAPRVLDLNQVVSNLQKMLGRLLGEDVDLYTALHPSLGRVKADPGQIEQVIMNLAVNARDAMPNGGKLTVETGNAVLDEAYAREHMGCKPGNYVMLAVADTGEGMSPETQARIFEPFFTTKELGKGTGLGLSTVYGIIKQSEGYIWVYSEVGIGTTFKIYLPRVDGQAEPTMTGKIPAYASYRGTETILLVEDEDGVRALIKQVLHRNGYTVLEARHGGEALLICERHPTTIHLLLTDVVLEQMSGRELAGRLATERPEMKVLFMSGYTDDAIVHHGVLDAKTAFLQKPFTTEALSRKVRGVLDGLPEE